MNKISKHFTRQEIACKCGCGFDTMDGETLMVADEVRDFVNHPITPSSGARCTRHNMDIGGGINSQHLRGRAMDLPMWSAEEARRVYDWLCNRYPNKYGFGLYDGFVHIDSRTDGPARWEVVSDG